MRKYKIFSGILLLEILLLTILLVAASISSVRKIPDRRANQQLVKNLMLTDLSLWTEARYSRHPSQADFFSAFQDFPAAIERFPAGSLTAPVAMYNASQSALFKGKLSSQIATPDSRK